MTTVKFGHEFREAPPHIVKAYERVNRQLETNTAGLAHTATRLALGQEIPESDTGVAKDINTLLDLTNHGARLGFEGDREASWAAVFEDENHQRASTERGYTRSHLSRILLEITDLKRRETEAVDSETRQK